MSHDGYQSFSLPATLKHFKTAILDDGMLLVGFDYQGKSVNVLNVESMSEWQHIVQAAERSTTITGVLLMSLKEGNFCAGADLEQMHEAQRQGSFRSMEQLVEIAHQIFDAMDRSAKPFVVAVEGSCLGGGLELALACHRRIASTHPKRASPCRKSNWVYFRGSAELNVFRV